MREWEASVLARLSGERNAKWAKMYIHAGVKPKLLYKHNEEWEKSIESHFLLLVIESTYLPIDSNNWLANKRLLSQLKATVGPLPLGRRISFGGRRRASKKNEVARTLSIKRVTWRGKCFLFHHENAFDFSRIQTSLFANHSHFFLICFLHFPTSPKVALLFTESSEQINYFYKFILSFSHFINIA